jgi:flagellar biosynthetic protein FliP
MRGRANRTLRGLAAGALALAIVAGAGAWAMAQETTPPPTGPVVPDPQELVDNFLGPDGFSATLEIMILLTVLTLAPAILIMTTCFTRVVVVLSLVRQALAVQQLPPNQVLIGLALFITFMVMAPTWTEVHEVAIAPYIDGEINQVEAYRRGIGPIREFLFRNTDESNLELFLDMSRTSLEKDPRADDFTRADVPTLVLVPAFVLSELKRAFLIGFLIYLPFLVIDMVVASTLISMGMLVLPPVLISLPFKLLLFVLVDGWYLIVGSLVRSYA